MIVMKCPTCTNDTMVPLFRNSVYTRGFGCTTCKTAIEQELPCCVCKSKVKVFTEPDLAINTQLICSDCSVKLRSGSLSINKIPSWRLKVDDASSEEVLNATPDTFGIPPRSSQAWTEYYESDHEKKKLREFESSQKELARELLN